MLVQEAPKEAQEALWTDLCISPATALQDMLHARLDAALERLPQVYKLSIYNRWLDSPDDVQCSGYVKKTDKVFAHEQSWQRMNLAGSRGNINASW
jgi:hypothetical protein